MPSSSWAPSLRPGQVVVLDNLSAHKSDDARKAVEAAGGRPLFLPLPSPDLNPIELAFDRPVGATAGAKDIVTAADVHCGFALPASEYGNRSKSPAFRPATPWLGWATPTSQRVRCLPQRFS